MIIEGDVDEMTPPTSQQLCHFLMNSQGTSVKARYGGGCNLLLNNLASNDNFDFSFSEFEYSDVQWYGGIFDQIYLLSSLFLTEMMKNDSVILYKYLENMLSISMIKFNVNYTGS